MLKRGTSEEQRFDDWLENKQADINMDLKHGDIIIWLNEAKDGNLIDYETIHELVEFRKIAINIFSLMDVDNDHTLYWQNGELDDLWQVIDEMINQEEPQESAQTRLLSDQGNNEKESRMRNWLNQQVSMDKVGFHEIQFFLWTGQIEHNIAIKDIMDKLYAKKSGSCQIYKCCQKIRQQRSQGRLVPKDPEENHFKDTKKLTLLYGHMLHVYDIYTDLSLASVMYDQSQLDKDRNYEFHVAFILIVMATFGPYIIQYSSLMSLIHNKGYFNSQEFKNFGRGKKMFLSLVFTAIGLLVMPFIDLCLKLMAIINVISLPFQCKCGHQEKLNKRIHVRLEQLLLSMFGLNPLELEVFEKQKKLTQLIFEDFVMIFLDFLIVMKFLKIESKSYKRLKKDNALLKQFGTTCLSIVSTTLSLFIESQGLRENLCEYIMLSVKAKQDWVPFGNLIKNRQIQNDIDYSLIEFRLPFITNCLGLYTMIEYQFSEESLQKLTTNLSQAKSARESDEIKDGGTNTQQPQADESTSKLDINKQMRDGENKFRLRQSLSDSELQKLYLQFVPRIRFGFSIFHVSAHAFLTFINQNSSQSQESMQDIFDLSGINWEQLVENSKMQEKDFKNPKTDNGKSLIQVCIENENSGGKQQWQLKKIMKILIEQEEFDPNIFDSSEEWNLLTFCYLNKKHQAFELLATVCSKKQYPQKRLQPNLANKDNTTIFGILFYHMGLAKESMKPDVKLQLLHDNFNDLNLNMPQIDMKDKNEIRSPIYVYLEREYDKTSKNLKELIANEKFYECFRMKKLELKEASQVHQLLSLNFITNKRNQGIIKEILTRHQEQIDGGFDKIFEDTDSYGNNLMHIVTCKFADKQWQQYIKDKELDSLKKIVRPLFGNKNSNEITPVQKLLKQQYTQPRPAFKPIQRLFELDLLDENSFVEIENEIIDYFYILSQKFWEANKLKDDKFIKEETFFKSFGDEHNQGKYYYLLKKKFELQGEEQIFQKYFFIQKYEDILQAFRENKLTRNMSESLNLNKTQVIMTLEDIENVFEKSGFIESNVRESQYRKQKSMIDSNYYETVPNDIQQKESKKQIKELRQKYYVMETILTTFIEISSLCDFVSDCYILYKLGTTIHTAWFSFSLFTMLCPYYTVYTSLMTYQIHYTRNQIEKQKYGCRQFLTNLVFILPTMLALLIFFDWIFMLLSTIIYPFVLISCFFGRYCFDKSDDFFNYFYQKLFGMSNMDVRGFRCQRTILQLQLESIPQVFFQGYIYYKIGVLMKNNFEEETKYFGVTKDAIMLSLVFAIVHIILEVINLYLESKTCQTSFFDYMIACYNARQGWIPSKDHFMIQNQGECMPLNQSQQSEEEDDEELSNDSSLMNQNASLDHDTISHCSKQHYSETIEFDKHDKQFGCIGFSLTFELSNKSIEILYQIISNMPILENQNELKLLKLGYCISNVSIKKIIQLVHLADKKIHIEFDEEILMKIMSENKKFMSQIQNPNDFDSSNEHLIIEIVCLKQYQILKIMVQLKAKLDITSKFEIKIDKNTKIQKDSSVFRIAYKLNNQEIISMIMAYKNALGLDYLVSKEMKQTEVIWNECAKAQKGIEMLCSSLLLDTIFHIPFDFQNSILFRMIDYVNKYPVIAQEMWECVFGAYIPNISSNEDKKKLMPVLCHAVNWVQKYPKTITICDKGAAEDITMDRQFLCMFVIIRRIFKEQTRRDDFQSYNRSIELDQSLKNAECKLKDFKNLYYIMHNRLDNLTVQEIHKCDKLVRVLGLDKCWSTYYYNSRNLLQEEDEKNVLTHIQEQDDEDKDFAYDIPENVLAIKSVFIEKVNAEDQPTQIEFQYQNHCKGTLKCDLSTPEFWEELNSEYINENTIFVASKELEKYELGDFRFKNINELLKTSITGEHEIRFKIQDKQKKTIKCKYIFEMYQSLNTNDK